MMNLAEYRNTATRLADFLPWAALVAPGVVLNKDGSFQRSARFRGPDLDSAVPAELVGVAGRLNNVLRRLGSGWALFVEAQRQPASTYPESRFPDAASVLVDAERKAAFEEDGAHYESAYFLTFLYLPPAWESAGAERFLYEGPNRSAGAEAHEILAGFIDRTDRVLQLLEGFMPECRWLDDAETLTYLHSCISTRRQRVRVPEVPMYLDGLLADQPLTGGLEPKLGDCHLRALTIVGFPGTTTPGILDELNRLAFAYRWSTRAIMLDKTDATKLLTRIRRQWFAKRKSIAAILKEVMTNEVSTLVDTDAHNKAIDADAALQELGADAVGAAYCTVTVTVWDDDPRIADERLRLVEKVIQGRDFTCMVERVNAVDAWLGSLPGHAYTELIALDRFIDGHTPFATKHGVKGAEFENVLVIVGRGWNKYNFGQMLEWIEAGPPVGRTEFFENNRNLFYVACSRPKIRLALLFTQVLSANAMAQLRAWFGADNIVALPAEPVAVPA